MKRQMNGTQSRWLKIMAQLVTASAAICFFSYVTADPDLWGHIKFGEDIWKAKSLIRVDPYSFTAHGQPWVNHEWLAELIFYFTYLHLGDTGLLFGKLVIGLVIAGLLYRLCDLGKNDAIVYTFIIVLAIVVISPGFMVRPQLFSFLFFTLYLGIFHLYFFKKKNLLFLLPCIMVFWVNCHGGFLMGWMFFSIVVVWKTISHFLFGEKDEPVGVIWFWFLVTSFSTLMNPYGYKLIVFLYKTLSTPRQISEWNPIPLIHMSHLHLKAMALLFFVVLFKRLKYGIGWEGAAIAMTLVASFSHQRHTPFFGIIITPYLAGGLSTLKSDIKSRMPRLTLSKISQNTLVVFLLLLVIYQAFYGISKYVLANGRIIVDAQIYPESAVKFLKQNSVNGNLLLPMEWGEYAIWKLYPDCKVSIDGRFRTVYPESVIKDHFVSALDSERWTALIEKYPADILLARQNSFFQELAKHSNQWLYVYSDYTAILFLKNNKRNQSFLQRFQTGQFIRPGPPSIYFP
jgi:hypothetical protein